MDSTFAHKVAKVLVEDRSYMFEVAKLCIFQPGVRFRFWKETESLQVDICFVCNEIAVQNRDSEETRIDDIDPIRRELIAFAREALPEDAELAALE